MSLKPLAEFPFDQPVRSLADARRVQQTLDAWRCYQPEDLAVLPRLCEAPPNADELHHHALSRATEALPFLLWEARERLAAFPELGWPAALSVKGFVASYVSNGPDYPAEVNFNQPQYDIGLSSEDMSTAWKAMNHLLGGPWNPKKPESPLRSLLQLLASRPSQEKQVAFDFSSLLALRRSVLLPDQFAALEASRLEEAWADAAPKVTSAKPRF